MDPRALAELIRECVQTTLAESSGLSSDDIALERPKNRDHGDWATSIALKLAKAAGANPRDLAASIASELLNHEGIASAEVAGPGFINITLDAGSAGALVKTIVEAGEAYGRGDELTGQVINVE